VTRLSLVRKIVHSIEPVRGENNVSKHFVGEIAFAQNPLRRQLLQVPESTRSLD